MKGQKSRAGRKLVPAIRGSIKRYPKLRGYKFQGRPKNLAIVNIGILDKKFKNSEVVTPRVLLKEKIICKIKGKLPKVKILGKGELTKSLIIKNCEVSKAAKEAIEKANGTIK